MVSAKGTRVTHRLVESTVQADVTQLVLKGDANETADADIYTATRADKILFHVPKAGYVVNAASSPAGVFILGLYVAWMVALIVRRPGGGRSDKGRNPDGRSHPGGARRTDRTKRSRSLARTAAPVVTAAMLTIASPAVAAPWTDAVVVTGTTMTACAVPKPVIASCTTSGLTQKTATIRFTEVSTPFAFTYSSTLAETGQSLTVVDDGATRHVDFSAGLLSTVFNQTYNVRIQTRLPAPNGTWVSVEANQPVTIGLLGLTLTCGTAS